MTYVPQGYLRVSDLAERYGCSYQHMSYIMLHYGQSIPFVKVAKARFFPLSDVDALWQSLSHTPGRKRRKALD